jgi:hypothetical protein
MTHVAALKWLKKGIKFQTLIIGLDGTLLQDD